MAISVVGIPQMVKTQDTWSGVQTCDAQSTMFEHMTTISKMDVPITFPSSYQAVEPASMPERQYKALKITQVGEGIRARTSWPQSVASRLTPGRGKHALER
jgi:hypothetical protein